MRCPGFPRRPVTRMMIGLMKRTAHAISGIGEKPALLTEGGLLLALNQWTALFGQNPALA